MKHRVLQSYSSVNPNALEWLLGKCQWAYMNRLITCQGRLDGTWDVTVWA